ncbi:MAG: type II toxin-antitoxin system RelE/ParE family toxin [Proteobacteria bacterium]|nr:type II toxin-antitoxin system RelE/ParE family toxin [Pseudomonadota bacterium]
MKLLLEKAARKGLDRMPARAADAMLMRLERIAVDPFAKHPNVEAMKGIRDSFRLRQGDWRAVYRLDRSAEEMRVVLIDVRGSVYR